MERYFCKCLNIIINVNVKETRESVGKDLIQIGLQSEIENIDPFFDGMLLDVRLAISGVEVSQPTLSKERCYGDWLVFTCLNCGLDTHAVHAAKGAGRVLLPVNIPHGNDAIKDIRESSNYSTFLKLSIVERTDRHKNNVMYFTPNSMVEVTEKLHNSCKKMIQAEEDAKNERVRIFTQKENHQFREYKMKANLDKERLLRTLRDFDFDYSNALFDTSSESYFGNHGMEERDVTTELPKFKVPNLIIPGKKKDNSESAKEGVSQSLPTYRGENLSQSIINHRNHKTSKSVREKKHFSDNDDILFDMEGYNEKDCEPFFESDDESSGDATSLESSGGFSGTSNRIAISAGSRDYLKPGNRVYATSLPVPVPLFNNLRHSYDPESDDEMKASPSLTKLAVSFKAVAKSMQDSTGMFGDLPPRRKEHSSELLSVCTENFSMT